MKALKVGGYIHEKGEKYPLICEIKTLNKKSKTDIKEIIQIGNKYFGKDQFLIDNYDIEVVKAETSLDDATPEGIILGFVAMGKETHLFNDKEYGKMIIIIPKPKYQTKEIVNGLIRRAENFFKSKRYLNNVLKIILQPTKNKMGEVFEEQNYTKNEISPETHYYTKDLSTRREQIVRYWEQQIYEGELNVDWSDAHERCWRCSEKRRLTECHIVPKALGGTNTPDNIVLLCHDCHLENPNIGDKGVMVDWLKAATRFSWGGLYGSYWRGRTIAEYENMYGTKFFDDLKNSGIIAENFNGLVNKYVEENTIIHWGESTVNVATMAGVYRQVIINNKNI